MDLFFNTLNKYTMYHALVPRCTPQIFSREKRVEEGGLVLGPN